MGSKKHTLKIRSGLRGEGQLADKTPVRYDRGLRKTCGPQGWWPAQMSTMLFWFVLARTTVMKGHSVPDAPWSPPWRERAKNIVGFRRPITK